MVNETALLIVCLVLSVVGLLLTLLFFLRGRRGRAFQAMALLFAPIGLYLTGAARLLVDGLQALWRWARDLTPDLTIWIGVALVALAILCWIIGSPWAAHSRTRRAIDKATGKSSATTAPTSAAGTATAAGTSTAGGQGADTRRPRKAQRNEKPKPNETADEDIDDIEAILKKRGIE